MDYLPLTQTVQVAVCPPLAAVMVHFPLPTAVTFPLASTVATLVSLLLQVTVPLPPEAFSV